MHDIHNIFMYIANNTPNIINERNKEINKEKKKRLDSQRYVILVINIIITLLTNLPSLHHEVYEKYKFGIFQENLFNSYLLINVTYLIAFNTFNGCISYIYYHI